MPQKQKTGLDDVPVAPLASAAAVDKEAMSIVPSEEEIRDATGQLKSGRASGVDVIPAELLKLGDEMVVQWLTELVTRVWDSEDVTSDWLKQVTIPLHKKGAFDRCGYYTSGASPS